MSPIMRNALAPNPLSPRHERFWPLQPRTKASAVAVSRFLSYCFPGSRVQRTTEMGSGSTCGFAGGVENRKKVRNCTRS